MLPGVDVDRPVNVSMELQSQPHTEVHCVELRRERTARHVADDW